MNRFKTVYERIIESVQITIGRLDWLEDLVSRLFGAKPLGALNVAG